MNVLELIEILEGCPEYMEIRMKLDCDGDHAAHTIDGAERQQDGALHYLLLEG